MIVIFCGDGKGRSSEQVVPLSDLLGLITQFRPTIEPAWRPETRKAARDLTGTTRRKVG